MLPVRSGFTTTLSSYWPKSLYSSYGRLAKQIEPDEVHLPDTIWDGVLGDNWDDALSVIYNAHTSDIPLLKPYATTDPRGSLVNYKNTPELLTAVSTLCDNNIAPNRPCGGCYTCVIRYFYTTFCLGWSDDELATIEDKINKIISVGKYFDTAVSETYSTGELYESLNDMNYWIEYFVMQKIIAEGG